MMQDADIIIVGSGPAGVTAAWPLVEAGLGVLMVDASEGELPSPPQHTSIQAWRDDPERWRDEIGTSGPLAASGMSPKFATPLSRAVLAGFDQVARLETRDFFAVGSIAAGGLSRIWGAFASRYDDTDLARFPGGAAEMARSYRRVIDRIGVSESEALPADDALTPPVARLARGHRQIPATPGFAITAASNAVLSAPRGQRQGCNACGLCLQSCARGSIYQSADELLQLQAHRNFSYRPGIKVARLSGREGAHIVEGHHRGLAVALRAPVVILAAGTLMTSSLALRRLGLVGRRVRLLTNPVGGAAFLVPGLVGTSLPGRSFGLGQLAYGLETEPGVNAFGVFYGADTLPLAAVADRLPFSRPAALRFARALAPALVLATGYLPGDLSDNWLTVEDDGANGRLQIEGRQGDRADRLLRQTFKSLGRQVRRRGAWMLPGSASALQPGADAHPVGTLPIGGEGPAATDGDGELQGLRGIYVADGAALPVLSARHPTLTIMANADRIGRRVAAQLSAAQVRRRAG